MRSLCGFATLRGIFARKDAKLQRKIASQTLSAAWCTPLVFTFAAAAQQPSPTPQIREEVTVTAAGAETAVGNTPASVGIVTRAAMDTSAAPAVDDILRQSVGFSIFRRSSGRNANPTAQGVSLRGVGSSGASRSIVLFDGVPLNDPFGGWIQWNRVSPIEIGRAELFRGGASPLYGDSGLSGAVNLLRREETGRHLAFEAFGGSQHTYSGSVFAGLGSERWQADIVAAWFHTRGFIPVESAARGPVDTVAGVESWLVRPRLTYRFGTRASIFAEPSYFSEDRTNGTPLQTNDTQTRSLVLGGDIDRKVNVRWRLFGGTQDYDQSFTAVNALRTAEDLTRLQTVPIQNVGGSLRLTAAVGRHTLVGGVEARTVRGSSDEIGFFGGTATSVSSSGGRQSTFGVYFQDIVTIGRLTLIGGIRFDRWSNYRALSTTRSVTTGATTVITFPDRDESTISPRASSLIKLNSQFSLYAAASRSFRSPTLNELYRAFRVGNVVTQANANLAAETAVNVEGGLLYGRTRTFIRANIFTANVRDAVANVTLSITPSLITRQRQNAARTRSTGFEIEAERRFAQFAVTAGYLFADSTIGSFPSDPTLVGRRVPQVARHQFTLQTRYSRGRWSLAAQFRASSSQFDDDLNQFRLEPFGQLDLFASRNISEHLRIFAAVENVFNTHYSVGRTPIRTVSSGINGRLGIRWN